MEPSYIEAIHSLERRAYALERVVMALASREGAFEGTLGHWRQVVSEGEQHNGELLDIGQTLARNIGGLPKP